MKETTDVPASPHLLIFFKADTKALSGINDKKWYNKWQKIENLCLLPKKPKEKIFSKSIKII